MGATGLALAAIDITYRIIVFNPPADPSGSKIFDTDPETGVTALAKSLFSSERRYLQVVDGGSPFSLAYGRALDLDNGAPRLVRADGSVFEPVISTRKMKIQPSSSAFGASMAYDGSFAGPEQVLAQAP